MRNQTFFSVIAVMSAVLAGGCRKSVPEAPAVILESDEISVSAEGGTFSVGFEIVNPVAGGEIAVSAENEDAAWLADFATEDGSITFRADANDTESVRSANVKVSYPGAADAEFLVIQEAGEPLPFTINLKEVLQTSVTFDVIPMDKEMSYMMMVTSQNYLDQEGIVSDEDLYMDDLEYLEEEMYYGATIDELTRKGDLIDVQYAAEPATDMIIYAYGIDSGTLEKLTDIVYCRFTTPPVEMITADFNIEATADGPSIFVGINPGNYDGRYFFEAVESSRLNGISPYEYAYDSFSSELSYYLWMADSMEEALDGLCFRGEASDIFEGEPNTAYTILAYAVNDQGLVCSEPSTAEVVTTEVEPSDNVISIDVTDIGPRSAVLGVTPSNSDSYTCAVVTDREIEGKDEAEIIQYVLDYYWYELNTQYGAFSEELTDLEPDTGYTVCAFGYQSETATTGLFSKSFRTSEDIEGEVTFELSADKYYDMEELKAEAPDLVESWGSKLAPDCETILATHITTTPESDEYYYLILNQSSEYEMSMSDDELKEYCYRQGATSPNIFGLHYDTGYMSVGFAVDRNGNWGPLEKLSFTLDPAGTSPVSELIEEYR